MTDALSAAFRFARCDLLVDQWEGGDRYTDNPKDPGGPTRHGVTLAALAAWRGRPCSAADVQALGAAEAAALRRAHYWTKVQGDQLPAGVDLMLYDAAINIGPAASVRLLQTALGLTGDGVVGAVTLLAVHTCPDFAALIDQLRALRCAYYRGRAGFAVFGTGWLRRTEACAQTAKAWAVKAA